MRTRNLDAQGSRKGLMGNFSNWSKMFLEMRKSSTAGMAKKALART
jgi:hypothetical protein